MSANVLASQDPQSSVPASIETGRRFLSVDALRGFDMFWIVGGDSLVHTLYQALPVAPLLLLHNQMDHKDWAGLAFYDLIFPLFVFIVGVSTVFSLSKTLQRDGKAAAIKRILTRTLLLYVFGVLTYGGISKGWDQVRWLGVLQRIALAYWFTAILFCTLRLRGLISVCIALLVGYWAVVSFIPIRDFDLSKAHLESLGLKPDSAETREKFLSTQNKVRGSFEDGRTVPQHFDYLYLPGYKWDGAYDPEGFLSTLPAISTCLLGVFAGLLLRNPKISDPLKVRYLLLAGVAGVIIGFAWGLQFPVIKKIWTSSYVLAAAGYSCIFLAIFYQIIEIWQWRRWCTPFVWIGMNAITIYLAAHFLDFEKLSKLVAGGPVHAALGAWGEFALACVGTALMLALARFLFTRKIFLRV